MKVLVTGSSGFIARFIVPRLAARGHSVVGIDKRTGPEFGDFFRFVHGNILDEQAVAMAMAEAEAEAVIHLAAEHKDFGISESLYHEVNVDGTEVLLQCAARLGVRKFVFFSSVAVYGTQAKPTTESLAPAPDSPYGRTKLLAEERIHAWIRQDAARQAVIVRPTVIFGPHNYANMYRLIQSVARRRYVGVGDGSNIKSVGYVENVAEAALYLMDHMQPGAATYNYADSPHLPTRDLVASIAHNLHMSVPSLRIPKPLALACVFPFDIIARTTGIDLPLTAKRIDKFTSSTHHEAQRILDSGFKPPFTLQEGISKTIAWYRSDQNRPTVADSESDAA